MGLIPLQSGAEYLVQEMSTPAGGPVEIVILGLCTFEEQGSHVPDVVLDFFGATFKVSRKTLRRRIKSPPVDVNWPPPNFEFMLVE